MAIFDADGHITETTEQVAKYLDDPYRQRSTTYGLYTADGGDRRMINTLGDWGGDAKSWLAALDRGGVEETVLYPTLGLFMSFVRDREWQVQSCRAYNRFVHEEFIAASPRLHAVALLPVLDPEAAAKELHIAVTQHGCVGAMVPADGGHLLGDRRFDPIWAEAQSLDLMVGLPASGAHLDDLRGRAGAIPEAAHRVPRGGLRLGAVLGGADGRRVRQARARGPGLE